MPHLSRTQLVLAAALVSSLGTAGVLSVTGSAQSTSAPHTLRFTAKETGGFESRGHFGEGSIVGFKDRLKSDDGTTGHDVGVCTIVDLRRKQAFCHAVAAFPQGRLFFEWLNRESSRRQTVAVVGGTGGYADARGSAVARENGRRTEITVTLAD